MNVISIALLGHKDHGKSTLIGSMLMLTKSVTQVRIREALKYSKRLHKDFEPAFILDSFHEERTGGLTIDTTRAEIQYKDNAFSFIDVPGHEELIKNMISGASYASTALLLLSAKADEGIQNQTKRHLFIAKMLGIGNLVVAVNKMDIVKYSESEKRFLELKNSILPFIEKIGFDLSKVRFVPISAYKGYNLIKRSGNMGWYDGKPLLEVIHLMSNTGTTDLKGPIRIVLQGFLEGRRDLVAGKLVRGTLSVGEDDICIVPLDINVKAKGIIVNGRKVKKAVAGEPVAVQLDKSIGREVRGSIICGLSYCPVPRDRINALIFLTGKPGKNLSIKFNGVDMQAESIKVNKHIDTKTGEEDLSKSIKPLDAIEAELKLSAKIPAERFADTRELGRFVLYSDGRFSGIGIIV